MELVADIDKVGDRDTDAVRVGETVVDIDVLIEGVSEAVMLVDVD